MGRWLFCVSGQGEGRDRPRSTDSLVMMFASSASTLDGEVAPFGAESCWVRLDLSPRSWTVPICGEASFFNVPKPGSSLAGAEEARWHVEVDGTRRN